MIKDRGDFVELKVIVEKFKRKLVNVKENGKFLLDEHGKKVKEEVEQYKGDIIVPTNFYKESIRVFGKTANHRYQVQKTKSTIYDRDSQKYYVVKHTLEEIYQALRKRSVVGFQIDRNK